MENSAEQPETSCEVKWEDRDHVVSRSSYEFFMSSQYCDVFLQAEDTLFPCHKLVLASSSSYFDKLFRSHQIERPILIFHDIKAADLLAVLEYTYTGKVEIALKNLDAFVDATIKLQMKGVSTADIPQKDSTTAQVVTFGNNNNLAAINSNNVKFEPVQQKSEESSLDSSLQTESSSEKTGKLRNRSNSLPLTQPAAKVPRKISPRQVRSGETKSRRPVVLPNHFKPFNLDSNEKRKCTKCAKFIFSTKEENIDDKFEHHVSLCKLDVHVREVSECPICKKMLGKSYLQRHIKAIHGPEAIQN